MEKSKECIGEKVINLHKEYGSLGRLLIIQGSQRSLVLNLRRQSVNMKCQRGEALEVVVQSDLVQKLFRRLT